MVRSVGGRVSWRSVGGSVSWRSVGGSELEECVWQGDVLVRSVDETCG